MIHHPYHVLCTRSFVIMFMLHDPNLSLKDGLICVMEDHDVRNQGATEAKNNLVRVDLMTGEIFPLVKYFCSLPNVEHTPLCEH